MSHTSMQGIKPTAEFDFCPLENWPTWITRFQRYAAAIKLAKDDPETQVSVLIYCMGAQAENIFESFGLAEAERKNFDTAVQKFKNYFVLK